MLRALQSLEICWFAYYLVETDPCKPTIKGHFFTVS